jgi:hypothetical protein
MYLRQAGLTRNPTFSYLYCVRCRGQRVASEAPLERKYSRYAQCRGTDSVLRILALLLAAHSRATPKQAKEPILTALNGLFASKLFWTFKHLIKEISVI